MIMRIINLNNFNIAQDLLAIKMIVYKIALTFSLDFHERLFVLVCGNGKILSPPENVG